MELPELAQRAKEHAFILRAGLCSHNYVKGIHHPYLSIDLIGNRPCVQGTTITNIYMGPVPHGELIPATRSCRKAA